MSERKGVRISLEKMLPFASLIVLFWGLAIASPHFLTRTNLSSVVRQTAVINVMALGMTIIIIAGGIDLSVGAILAMGGFLGTMAMAHGRLSQADAYYCAVTVVLGLSILFLPGRWFIYRYMGRWAGAPIAIAGLVSAIVMHGGMPIPVGVAVGILTGLGCGLLNGTLAARLKIAPFIVTLGTLGIFRGMTLIISNGLPVHEIPPGFAYLGEGSFLYVPFVLWLLLLCAIATHFLLEHTRLGRYAFAIGSNAAAAIYAGIPVGPYTIAVYAIGGMLTGLSGMIEASRLMTGQPTAGQGYELQAIAAVVIGGGSLTGGEGSVAGTLIGAFIMGLLSNGSDLLGISNYVQQVVIGAVIILAVTVDEVRKRGSLGASA